MRIQRSLELVALAALIAGCGGAAATPTPKPAPTAAPTPVATPAPSAAAPSAAASQASGGTQVAVDEHEWQIALAQTTVPAGQVTFNISNTGEKDHEFVVIQSTLAEDQLPVADDEVNEDDPAIHAVDELEDIASGSSGNKLTVDLQPGTYIVFCNLTAHYGKGMHSTLTVQ